MTVPYYTGEQLSQSFYLSLTTSLIALFFDLMALISPYWIESYDVVHGSFVRLGVWEVCFNDFTHPKDYKARSFSGCFLLCFVTNVPGLCASPELVDLDIYINPYWLTGVRFLLLVSMICNVMVCLSFFIYYWNVCGSKKIENRVCLSATNCGLMAFGTVCWAVSVILFGVQSQDRLWMPRPDQNLLSWSFWSANVCAFVSGICAVCCYLHTKRLGMQRKEEEMAAQQLRADPYMQQQAAYPGWGDQGAHTEGVLDFGALPVPTDFEKDSHGVLS